MNLINESQDYVQMSDTEFRPNRATNVESVDINSYAPVREVSLSHSLFSRTSRLLLQRTPLPNVMKIRQTVRYIDGELLRGARSGQSSVKCAYKGFP